MNLKTEISLLLSKYENIKDDNELIFLLNKEFDKKYNKQDLLNYYVSMTELEIDNRIVNNYGYFNQHRYLDI